MTNDNVTAEDIKATAEAKVDEAVENAKSKFESAKEAVNGLSLNQKLVVTGAVAVLLSIVTSKAVSRLRAIRVDASTHVDEVLIVLPEDSTK